MKSWITLLAQTGCVDRHGHWFAQEIEQHHGAAFGIVHLVDRFQSGKGAFGDAHAVAMGLVKGIELSLETAAKAN